MSDKRTFILNPQSRPRAAQALKDAPEGYAVTIGEPTRNGDQNAKFHAICGDLAKSGLPWAGKKRTTAQWKVLLVSGHAVATSEGSEIIPGLEHEFINIRESTALMSKRRSASLITYAIAFCDLNGVALSEPRELEAA
jgi:NinB protein